MPTRKPDDERNAGPAGAGDRAADEGTAAGRMDGHTEDLSHDDFMSLPIERLARRTGRTAPARMSDEEERDWREQAWRNHVQDLQNRDEWGTAAQATEPPKGDDPNL